MPTARSAACRLSRPGSIRFANRQSQMKKRTGWLIGAVALSAGAIGAASAYWKQRNMEERRASDVWARPGMMVTFRAELMPGRERHERSFRVKELLSSGRVLLH